ncbi:MAG: ECF transporter S component [Ruminococcaceae bacterium]|nr:ECF transporter S component [Oscillospiraceae bacterium]
MQNKNMTNTRKLVVTAMLSSIATVLMLFEIPLPFVAPPFYKMDFSEIPVLIGAFSLGPLSGVIIEAIKVLLNLIINGTTTGGVGELANFLIGCSFVVPAALIYKYKKTKVGAIISMAVGTVAMAVLGVIINAYLMIPIYSQFMPLEQIIQMGKDIVPFIKDTLTFCIFCVAPFNFIKGVLISTITTFIYKPLSRVIHPKS